MKSMNPLLAETFGTIWLVSGGCGAAVLGRSHRWRRARRTRL